MTSVSLSHPGLVRRNNEDFISTDDALGIYLLADGMGGHNIAWRIAAGEAAAGSFPFIEKEHLLIGIFSIKKIFADSAGETGLDKTQLDGVVGECHALNEVLHPLGLGMTVLRREVRSGLGQGDFQHTEPVIHRSPSSRGYFQIADALAGSSAMISSVHLLAAIVGVPGEHFGNL
jgi:hypothetical protein